MIGGCSSTLAKELTGRSDLYLISCVDADLRRLVEGQNVACCDVWFD